MFENFHDALNTNDGILFFDGDFCKVTFFANQIEIIGVDLGKVDKILVIIRILMKMILKLLFISDFWLGVTNLKNVKHLKKR